jgi:hypothetical protein
VIFLSELGFTTVVSLAIFWITRHLDEKAYAVDQKASADCTACVGYLSAAVKKHMLHLVI